MAKNPNYLKGIFSASMDGGNYLITNWMMMYMKKEPKVRLYGLVIAQKFRYFKFATIGNSNLCNPLILLKVILYFFFFSSDIRLWDISSRLI